MRKERRNRCGGLVKTSKLRRGRRCEVSRVDSTKRRLYPTGKAQCARDGKTEGRVWRGRSPTPFRNRGYC
ncbi:unnamed protein product [Chondrus crispus]|uniref:Uncharacterized protein n=1 Tax=Chondrus crispus TaxID=2769 RepID=R7Q880_CHOCR|nr:unnamed protein product [Chondrus crispus]CDF33988.1 unnamed protein product [Chondrus crispus]|eukprot:XP_005713807.1 unnamed protein product [Chondrus crispus]